MEVTAKNKTMFWPVAEGNGVATRSDVVKAAARCNCIVLLCVVSGGNVEE